ncbi:MAG: glycosyltransferase family 2 protein [Clostridia bacterium]|nr:glycosyltransferase family 2 protein [Clostridia bacterium]
MFYEFLADMNFLVGFILFLCYSYQIFYTIVPFSIKPRRHREPIKKHRIGILIAARNEEAVIGNLLDSIAAQDYPRELIHPFVIADNCTDKTAKIAEERGATVFERFNKEKIGKGYALDYAIDKLHENGEWSEIDGFIVLDADNLLTNNYITEMNKTFNDGFEAFTSYRNSKNYGDNWISAGYGLWYIRESKFLHYARMLLHSSAAISGTGFFVSRSLLDRFNGWKFYLLTEDIEFSMFAIINGVRIGCSVNAELYDEQPVTFEQSYKQRLRWSKGFFQVWKKHGKELIKGIFKHRKFAFFDMTMNVMPAFLLTVALLSTSVASILFSIFGWGDPSPVVESLLGYVGFTYSIMLLMGLVTLISEWKKIHTTADRKIGFLLLFPIFMYTYIPISVIALFKPVKWEQIHHTRAKSLDDIVRKDK